MVTATAPFPTPEVVCARLGAPHRALLASASGGDEDRWSIVTGGPCERVAYRAGSLSLFTGGRWKSARGCPLDFLGERMDALGLAELDRDTSLPFAAGAIGVLGYGLRHRFERLPEARCADPFPDLWFGLHGRALVYDHHAQVWHARGDWPAAELVRLLAPGVLGPPASCRGGALSRGPSREQYVRTVRRVLEHIVAGDVYQVNFAQRFTAPFVTDAFDAYRRLVRLNPAPYAAYLELEGDLRVASSSPELFLELAGGRARTRPIKGTRPRGATPAEDVRLEAELAGSVKDGAELAMIVDLMRNDLGRVARYGSVRVTCPGVVERRPSVFHRVATVEAELADGRDWRDLVRATFPGGSITGAPKIRAMEIIAGLESAERGPYTGAIGYIGASGRLALSIAIRTAMFDGARAWYGAGGGIVADSDPDAEYEECLVKAMPFLRLMAGEG